MEKSPQPRLTEITLTVGLTDEEIAAVDGEIAIFNEFGHGHPTQGTWTRERVLALWLEVWAMRATQEREVRTQMLVRAEQQLEQR